MGMWCFGVRRLPCCRAMCVRCVATDRVLPCAEETAPPESLLERAAGWLPPAQSGPLFPETPPSKPVVKQQSNSGIVVEQPSNTGNQICSSPLPTPLQLRAPLTRGSERVGAPRPRPRSSRLLAPTQRSGCGVVLR